MFFSGIRYAISPTLPVQRQNELAKLLDANGATIVDFSEATHVVSNTLQFEGQESLAEDCKIVTDEWVDRSIVQGKLQETRYFSADPIMIFSGVVACVADLEPCDTEVIAAGINALGGLFREGYTRDCTHVLALRSDSDKYLTAMHYASATRVKVVLPHWFDDCFKLLVRLPEDPYLWPDPPIMKTNYALNKARLAPPTKALVKTAVLEEEPAEKIAVLGKSEANIWNGKRILLSASLNLAEGRREVVEAAVQRAGGVIIQATDEAVDVEDADVFVTSRRFGTAFIKVVRANKIVGTLSWLFSVHESGIVTSPLDQLLHFPSPRPPLRGFENHKITATNYEGDARRYLKKLIELMGASFTPQMTAQNTVVIAAYIKGEKSTKAREWNIPIVNHIWLEDCFASWTHVTPAQEKYVSFPPGVNFGDLVCKRRVHALTDEELAEIERESLEAEAKDTSEKKETALAGRKKVQKEKEGEVERPPGKSSPTRNVQKSPAKSISGQSRSSQGNDHHTPLKPAASRLNVQRPSQRLEEEEEEDEEDDKDVSQPPRKPRGRVSKRQRKTAATSRNRSDLESEEEDEYVPRKPTKVAQNIATPKSSPIKSNAKMEVIHVGDDSSEEVDEQVLRPAQKSKKESVTKTPGQTSKKTGTISTTKSLKGKSKSVLELLDDDEFASSSDEDALPTESPKKKQSNSSKMKGAKSNRRTTEYEEEEEEEEEEMEEEIVPKARHRPRNAVAGPSNPVTSRQEPKTPIRKQASLPGPTPGKQVYVELPSPQKSSSQRSAGAASFNASPAKRAPPKSAPSKSRRVSHDSDDEVEEEQEQDESQSSSPRESPVETPSRSSRFTDDAIRRSSQPMPIISSNPLRTPSKRQAASKATAKLHEDALDIIKFEKERRSGKVRGSWEDGKDKLKKDEGGKKRRLSAAHDGSEEEELYSRNKKKRKSEDVEERRAVIKKSKEPRMSEALSDDEEEEPDDDEWYFNEEIRIMMTQVVLDKKVLDGLRRLGVKVASKPTECNLLVANTIGRTEKFLCAMATARSIVTEAWATDSVNKKRILPPDDYFLKDPVGEKKHNFRLADALRRAQTSNKKLLEGHTFYLTQSLPRSEKYTTYKNVIQSAGGKVQLTTPTIRILKGHLDRHVLSTEIDRSITDPLADEGFHVYVPEFILVGILTQRLDWDDTPHRLDKN